MTVANVSAQDFFRAAYENRYTWDERFPGYTADVTLQQGDTTHTGKIRINPNLTADVMDFADETAANAVKQQAWEVAIHRVRRSFEQTHGENTFSYGETAPNGAVEVLLGGKSAGDRYQVKDDTVTLVHRHIHGVVVTINTFSVHDTGEGYLAHEYDSVYHDPQTGAQKGGLSKFTDEYTKVGDYQILSRRVIETEKDGQPITMDFQFGNIQLLPADR